MARQSYKTKIWEGKDVEWDTSIDNRGNFTVRSGHVDSTAGLNLVIDGDWKYITELTNLRLKGTPSPLEKK